MPTKGMEEGAGGGVPELDVVVEGGGGDEGAGRGEGDVVDLFLVTEEPGHGFDCCGVAGGGGRRGPEVDGAVIGGGDEAFGEGAVDGCGGLEPLFCFGQLLVVGWGDGAGVVVVGGSENEVRGEGEMVDPVGVRGEGADQSAFGRVPKFDGFVVGGGIDGASPTPADAGDGGFVARENQVYPL